MRTIEITSRFKIFDSPGELTEQERELLDAAKEATKGAYAPYSNFFVGAAALLENGKIVIGNNQENVAYPDGLCAERVALFAASSQYPDVPITAIAITATTPEKKTHEPIAPCGSCRQVLSEYEIARQHRIKIILQGDEGDIYIADAVSDLLPLTFSLDILRSKT